MKILIDIGHPAHVHLFRNLYAELKTNGHRFFVAVKDIKSAKYLLDHYGMKYSDLGSKMDSLIGKGIQQLKYDWLLFNLVRKNNISLALGSSISITHVSKFTRMESIVFDDDDDDAEPLFVRFGHPFCDFLFTPDAIGVRRKRKETLFYPGFHELAYLHPKRFTPNPGVLDEAGLIPGETFFIMRFNVFKAHHDVGVKGLSLGQKLELVDILAPHGKIFITTEREIEPELKVYQYKINPEKIHSLMTYATLFIGDSQTMTSEAAVLGTPALKCNSLAGKLSVPNELEETFNLCYSFSPQKFPALVEKLKVLMAMPDLKKEWQERREKMLQQKIDVTGFWLWFIENYPKCKNTIAFRPEFWNQFR